MSNFIASYGTADGTLKWRHDTGDFLEGNPIVNRKRNEVYIGCEDNNLYAIDATNGDLKWNYTAKNWITSTVALDHKDNILFGIVVHIIIIDLK